MAEEENTAQIDSPSPKKAVQAKKPEHQKVKHQGHRHKQTHPGRVEQNQREQTLPQNKGPTAADGHPGSPDQAVRRQRPVQTGIQKHRHGLSVAPFRPFQFDPARDEVGTDSL